MRRMFSSKWPKILTFSHKSTKGMKMSIEIPDEVLVLLQTGKAIEGTIKMDLMTCGTKCLGADATGQGADGLPATHDDDCGNK